MDFPVEGSGHSSSPKRIEQPATFERGESSGPKAPAAENAIHSADSVLHYDAALKLVRTFTRDEVPESIQDRVVVALRDAINHPTTSASDEAAGRTVSNLGYLLQTGKLPLVHQPDVAADLINKSTPELSNISPDWQATAVERLGLTLSFNQSRNLGIRTKLHMVRAIYARANQHWANSAQQRHTLRSPAMATYASEPAHEPEVCAEITKYALGYLERGEAAPQSIARGAIIKSWGAALCQRGVPEHLRPHMGRTLMKSLEPFRENDPDYSEAVYYLAEAAAQVPEAKIPLEFFANYVDHPGIIATEIVDTHRGIRIQLSDALIKGPSPVRDFLLSQLTFTAFLGRCEHEPWNLEALLIHSTPVYISQLVSHARIMLDHEERLVQTMLRNRPMSEELCRLQNRHLKPEELLGLLVKNHQAQMEEVREHSDMARRLQRFIEKSEQSLRERAAQP